MLEGAKELIGRNTRISLWYFLVGKPGGGKSAYECIGPEGSMPSQFRIVAEFGMPPSCLWW